MGINQLIPLHLIYDGLSLLVEFAYMIVLSDITKIKCRCCVGHIYRDSLCVIMAKSCFLIPSRWFYLSVFPLTGYITEFGLDKEPMSDMRKAKTHESFIKVKGDFNCDSFFIVCYCEAFISKSLNI